MAVEGILQYGGHRWLLYVRHLRRHRPSRRSLLCRAQACCRRTAALAPKGKGKGWYWGGLAFGAIMGAILYPTIYAWCSKNRPAFWNQEATWYIGMWTFLCGVFTILFMVVAYNCYSKKNGSTWQSAA